MGQIGSPFRGPELSGQTDLLYLKKMMCSGHIKFAGLGCVCDTALAHSMCVPVWDQYDTGPAQHLTTANNIGYT